MNSVEDIKKVCVVGAGAMGRQIAYGCALHGYDTFCTDSYAPSLEAAQKWRKIILPED
jgi:3-hydroxybutyryl-CoA dehydrogenase